MMRFLFQLTTSQGGRPSVRDIIRFGEIFQLTTSQGGRRIRQGVLSFLLQHFNSRPHKEVDSPYKRLSFTSSISTHDLTRRSTAESLIIFDNMPISTHDLTRRSTIVNVGIVNNRGISTHDLTRRSTHFAIIV